ncbi:MAG: protein TonB [Sulfurimonas sp.]|jgi:protein TonB|uniref:energy transducer TonB n=1 Tax=Sulfurimonas sp. TaxID=2022749 RepID=UPI0039E56DE4
MIRHSSSFIFSLILHVVALIAIFFVYKSIPKKEPTQEKKKICIDLCNVSIKPIPKVLLVVEKPKIIPKKIAPQIIKPPIKKLKVKPVIKKKKKVVVKKKLPVIEPIPIKDIKIKEEPKEIIEEKIELIEPIEATTVQEPLENLGQKQKRLEKEYISEHIKKISQLLSENLYYPRSARKRNIQGAVIVKFTLSTSAQVYNIEIISSKSEILSRAAIKTIEDLSGSFPHPPEELVLHVPITYKLSK